MAKKHPETRTDEKGSITRRGYLAGAGAAVGSASLFAGASQTVGAVEYEVIEVGTGETYSRSLGDGETLKNVLFDVSAAGASVDIRATGSDWTIRNVGFEGEDGTGNQDATILCAVDRGSTGVIENVYLGDGDEGASHTEGRAAIFVLPSHGGTLELRRVYIEGRTDNGMYGSDPGHTAVSSNGGEIHVYDSYSANNTASNWRFGTNGSFMQNSVSWGGPHRGVWCYFEHLELIDCDCGDNGRSVEAGEPAYSKSAHAEVTLADTRYDGLNTRESTNAIHTENADPDDPVHRVPDGCPTSAKAAASGRRTNENEEDDSGEKDEEDTEFPEDSHLLAFVTEPEANLAAYKFSADGPVEFSEAPYESPSGRSIVGGTYEAEDFVEEVEGSWHAGGVTGNGFGDAFVVDGPVTEIKIDQPDVMWVELDGDELRSEEIIARTADDEGSDDEDGEEGVETSLDISIAETNEPISGGEYLEVTVDIENSGDDDAADDVRLLVGSGSDEVDVTEVSLEAGVSKSITLGYETYPVRQDVEFPIRVVTTEDNDESIVSVHEARSGEAEFVMTIEDTSDPVDAGERLEVTTRIENVGGAEATQRIELNAGGYVDSADLTLDSGASETVTLGYDTYPVRQDVEFTVRVESEDDADSSTVAVNGRN